MGPGTAAGADGWTGEDIRHETEQALPTLEQEISQAVLPLPLVTTTAALHVDNLLKGLSIAYAGIARGINQGQLESGMSHLFHRSVQRAMAMVSRRQLLAYRAYAAPSASPNRLTCCASRLRCSAASSAMPTEASSPAR